MTRVKDLPIPGSISPSDVVVMDVTVGGVGPVTCKVPLSMLCAAANTLAAPVALTDATTILTDASLGSTFTVTLAGNRILGNPINMTNGMVYTWYVTQDGAGGHTLAYDTMFAWSGGTPPTITATAAKTSILSGQYIAATGKIYMSSSLGY